MSSALDVAKATPADLVTVLGWLEREYEEDGEGFWSNRAVIADALEYDDLWVIRRGGEAVAFQVGSYGATIANVRKDWRRKGLGDALFAASLERAFDDNVNLLSIECSPRSSWSYWQRHGFERYGDMRDWGKLTARRVLARAFDVPTHLPEAQVAVGFYPEAATYGRDVPPIAVHRVRGGRLDCGAIMLERRIIGLSDDEPEGKDLAVKIEVDGNQRCFSKAKHGAAEKSGVTHDRRGGTFYIDCVEPREE
jgi:GNAT superfamily N-acetyltransferase